MSTGRKQRFAIAVIAATVGVGGCTPPTPPARGVDYYKAHRDEAKTVADQCAAGTTTGPNCEAAVQAIASVKADATFKDALKTSKRKNQVGRNW